MTRPIGSQGSPPPDSMSHLRHAVAATGMTGISAYAGKVDRWLIADDKAFAGVEAAFHDYKKAMIATDKAAMRYQGPGNHRPRVVDLVETPPRAPQGMPFRRAALGGVAAAGTVFTVLAAKASFEQGKAVSGTLFGASAAANLVTAIAGFSGKVLRLAPRFAIAGSLAGTVAMIAGS